MKVLSTLSIVSLFCYSFLIFNTTNITHAIVSDPNDFTNGANWNAQPNFSNPGYPPNPTGAPQTINGVQTWTPQYIAPQSPVITPNQQPQALLDQTSPSGSATCGISPKDGKWNYCLLAPMNGLVGDKITGTGGDTVESLDLSTSGIRQFFSKVYRVGVMAAIGLAIVMITFGGLQLATTDSVSGTDSGRKKVNAALAGLFIALFSYVLLYTINPELVKNGEGDIFQSPSAVTTP